MTNRYDPPSEAPEPSRRGLHGGRLIHEECPDCNDRGWIKKIDEFGEPYYVDCPACGGTGEIETEDLPE
jgi:DnaJ-class molecular chaperone